MMAKITRNRESARILHRRRDHRNASNHSFIEMNQWNDGIQQKVCLERRCRRSTPHRVSRSASAHSRRSIKHYGTITIHHQEWKTQKRSNSKQLVIQSIFPIEMILNKYFLNEFLFSSKLSNSNRHQHQTNRNLSPSHATSWLQTLTNSPFRNSAALDCGTSWCPLFVKSQPRWPEHRVPPSTTPCCQQFLRGKETKKVKD